MKLNALNRMGFIGQHTKLGDVLEHLTSEIENIGKLLTVTITYSYGSYEEEMFDKFPSTDQPTTLQYGEGATIMGARVHPDYVSTFEFLGWQNEDGVLVTDEYYIPIDDSLVSVKRNMTLTPFLKRLR